MILNHDSKCIFLVVVHFFQTRSTLASLSLPLPLSLLSLSLSLPPCLAPSPLLSLLSLSPFPSLWTEKKCKRVKVMPSKRSGVVYSVRESMSGFPANAYHQCWSAGLGLSLFSSPSPSLSYPLSLWTEDKCKRVKVVSPSEVGWCIVWEKACLLYQQTPATNAGVRVWVLSPFSFSPSPLSLTLSLFGQKTNAKELK